MHGTHRDDDAVVYRGSDGRLTAATVDLFTPVVDDPYDYGRVAATNSLSDIYAMGGVPRLALSILGYPPKLFSPAVPNRIIQGAVDQCARAGVVLGGGHTVKSGEVLFGLAVFGDFPEGRVLEKGGARPGDRLCLTKPLGIGILTTAIKRKLLGETEVATVVELMARLNDAAARLAVQAGAVCATDVTGFGLLGHLGEMVGASGCSVRLEAAAVPLLPRSRELAAAGVVPGGSFANLEFASRFTDFDTTVDHTTQLLLADAQTSGGLLVPLPAPAAADFVQRGRELGCEFAVIGEFVAGDGRIMVA